MLASVWLAGARPLTPLRADRSVVMHGTAVKPEPTKPTRDQPVTPSVRYDMPEGKRPSWFHVPAPGGSNTRFAELQESLGELKLNTVCEEAQCPNIGECWNGGTGTIMLLGDTCTRGCKFCAVKTDQAPPEPDPDEPMNTAMAVGQWGIDYVVLTSVDRDDIPDGGAGHFAKTVQLLKISKPSIRVECLVSDFAGDHEAVGTLATSGLDVFAHNVETVERLQPYVRDKRANYRQSLGVLQAAKAKAAEAGKRVYTKTSLMLGLGETRDEVMQAMADIRSAGVDVLTLGQYLRPTEHHLAVRLPPSIKLAALVAIAPPRLSPPFACDHQAGHPCGTPSAPSLQGPPPLPPPSSSSAAKPPHARSLALTQVVDYVTPGEFAWYQEQAEAMGFRYVASGPMVRSSYKAGEFFMEAMMARDDGDEAAAAKLAEAGDEAEASTAARQAQAAGSADDAAAWLAERGIHPPEKKLQLEQ